jgi:hypothetical protein
VAIVLAAVVLGGCPIYPENGAADGPQPAGGVAGPYGEAGPEPAFDAPADPPDSGAADAGPDGRLDVAGEEPGADAQGDAGPAEAAGGDAEAPADSDSELPDAPTGG